MTTKQPRSRAICWTVLWSMVTATSMATPLQRYDHGEPTPHEQHLLELVNTARADPAAEATRLGLDLNKGIPSGTITREAKPPLAFHPILLEAARRHSDWMLLNNIFSHDGLEGSSPTARAAALGYSFGIYENIGHRYTNAALNVSAFTRRIHDDLFRSVTGHRQTLMEPSLTVAGLGVRSGKWGVFNDLMVTQKFSAGGETVDSGPFIVGVVYSDINRNRAFDPGEGVQGIEVRPDAGSHYAVTSASGGFAIPLVPVHTNHVDVRLPFALSDGTPHDEKWAQVKSYDEQFRSDSRHAARDLNLRLTWSGGPLASPLETVVRVKEPTRIHYQLIGTDSVFYSFSMITSESVRANLMLDEGGGPTVKRAQSIRFSPFRPVTYAPGRVLRPAVRASSRLPVEVTSSRPTVASESGGRLVVAGAGTTTISARQAGDEVFEAAAHQEQDLVVNRAKQVVTFRLKAKIEPGTGSLSLDARASSRLPVTFESDAPGVVSIDGNLAVIRERGTATITARQAGNANYLEAKPVVRRLMVQ